MHRPDDIFSFQDRSFIEGFSDEVRTPDDGHGQDLADAAEEFFSNEDSGFDGRQEEPQPEKPFFVDASLADLDFSSLTGDLKSSLRRLDIELARRKARPVLVRGKKHAPLPKVVPVDRSSTLHGKDFNQKTIRNVMVPRDRSVLVQGVDEFMLSNLPDDYAAKRIGTYKGEKLKELILIMDNTDSSSDFTLELFNPSQMLDYSVSNSQNLNNWVTVAGGTGARYSDVLFYLLANPTMIINGRFLVSGSDSAAQRSQGLRFYNKNLMGEQFVAPLNISSNLDTMQFQSNVIYFDIMRDLGRPCIPDGMEVIRYTVLAGNSVTFCFYFKQHILRNEAFQEARNVKALKVI